MSTHLYYLPVQFSGVTLLAFAARAKPGIFASLGSQRKTCSRNFH
jgi:hypothetical protein